MSGNAAAKRAMLRQPWELTKSSQVFRSSMIVAVFGFATWAWKVNYDANNVDPHNVTPQ
jgi:hypothetical protein